MTTSTSIPQPPPNRLKILSAGIYSSRLESFKNLPDKNWQDEFHRYARSMPPNV
jgi:hypothetical protein